jgi:FkbM family methyltransferase
MTNMVPLQPPPAWGAHKPGVAASAVLWMSRNSIVGRGLLRKTTAAAFKALHAGPVDAALWGTNVRLYPDNNVVERKALLRPDHFDAQEREHLQRVMSKAGAVFVDVGGNAGLYSLDAALHAGDGATIVMIEPDADLIARFNFNLNEARRGGRISPSLNVQTVAAAISDRDGSGVLSASGDEGSRNLVAGTAAAGLAVQLRTLLSVVRDARADHIDIMKIDVEGHEDKVLPPFLRDAPQSLWPGLIIIEHLQRALWRPDCIAGALARGYGIVKTTRNNTFLVKN